MTERAFADGDVFAAEVEKQDFGLTRACLLLCRDERPGLDVDAELARFDAWTARVADARDEGADFPAALRRVLAVEERFRGNYTDYGDPENSLLDSVLERRVGIPITLGVVYLEVARRLEEPLVAVGMPVHFLVRHEDTLIDPFHEGITVTRADCEHIVRRATRGTLGVTDEMLAGTPDRDVLTRVLANLKNAYARRHDNERALRTSERILQVSPFAVTEYRDRGLFKRMLGDTEGARADLETYLGMMPRAKDAAAVRKLAERL